MKIRFFIASVNNIFNELMFIHVNSKYVRFSMHYFLCFITVTYTRGDKLSSVAKRRFMYANVQVNVFVDIYY